MCCYILLFWLGDSKIYRLIKGLGCYGKKDENFQVLKTRQLNCTKRQTLASTQPIWITFALFMLTTFQKPTRSIATDALSIHTHQLTHKYTKYQSPPTRVHTYLSRNSFKGGQFNLVTLSYLVSVTSNLQCCLPIN